MRKVSKKSKDCNCHYTGFHPSLGTLPKRKLKSKDLLGLSPSPKLEQTKTEARPKTTKENAGSKPARKPKAKP